MIRSIEVCKFMENIALKLKLKIHKSLLLTGDQKLMKDNLWKIRKVINL